MIAIGRSAAVTPRPSSRAATSAWVSASIHWWGSRLRAAYSRRAIDAGVNSDPMICSVSAALDINAGSAGEERLEDDVAQPGVAQHPRTEDVDRHHHDLTRPGDPGRQVRALPSDQVDLAEEPPGAVAGDQLTVRAEHLDETTQDHDPVVVVIGRREQDLTLGDLATLTEGEHDGQLLVVELREHHRVGRLSLAHRGDGIAGRGWSALVRRSSVISALSIATSQRWVVLPSRSAALIRAGGRPWPAQGNDSGHPGPSTDRR